MSQCLISNISEIMMVAKLCWWCQKSLGQYTDAVYHEGWKMLFMKMDAVVDEATLVLLW